ADDRAEATPVVMISDGFWKRRFGRDAKALGRKIRINSDAFVIVGVLPRGFQSSPGPPEVTQDVTLPLVQFDRIRRDGHSHLDECAVIGRLRAGANEQHALLEITSAAREAAPEGSAADQPVIRLTSVVPPGFWNLIPRSSQALEAFLPLFLFLLAITAVLFISCANLAGLLLARGASRRHEIAARIVVGAGRPRIVRQLLLESIVLSVFGGALGI